jgi:hypothetical protein
MGPPGHAVGGVASVLFTLDHRVFFMGSDSKIRVASDWERAEVLRQVLSWRDSSARPICNS